MTFQRLRFFVGLALLLFFLVFISTIVIGFSASGVNVVENSSGVALDIRKDNEIVLDINSSIVNDSAQMNFSTVVPDVQPVVNTPVVDTGRATRAS